MKNYHLPATIYLGLTVLGIILWLPFPEICHFIGASSIVYAFLFGAAYSKISFVALLWILFFVVNIVIWYIYGKKKNKYIYFFATVGLELLVSLVFICVKAFIANYTDIVIAIVGFVVRTVTCCILSYIGLKQKTKDRKTGDSLCEP